MLNYTQPGTPSRVRFAAPYSRALDRASPLRQISFLEGDAGRMFAFLLASGATNETKFKPRIVLQLHQLPADFH